MNQGAIAPLVSVVVPTYQHAAFIGPCLDGILMQRTTFAVEVLLGEDESTDGTREICRRYAEAHPERIRLFLRSRKDVMMIDGRPTGRANLLALLAEARGRYIALCEGDDHWTDPDKLQKQVDAIEADPLAVGCFTNAWNEEDGVRTPYLDGLQKRVPMAPVTRKDVVLGQNIATCTVVFLRETIRTMPPQMITAPVGDTILFTHITRAGHLVYLPESTAVRHVHAGGVYSMKSDIFKTEVHARLLELLDDMTDGEYREAIHRKRMNLLLHGWQLAERSRDRKAMRYFWKAIAAERGHSWRWTTTMRNALKAWYPGIEGFLFKTR